MKWANNGAPTKGGAETWQPPCNLLLNAFGGLEPISDRISDTKRRKGRK